MEIKTINDAFMYFSQLQDEQIAKIENTKLAYCINKNLKRLNEELNKYRIKPSDEYFTYKRELDQARMPLQGVTPDKPLDPAVKASVDLKLKEIEDKYKPIKDAFVDMQAKQMEALKGEFKFRFFLIDMETLPSNLTPLQMNILENMIRE